MSIERWTGNFHGHLHSNRVMRNQGYYDPVLCEIAYADVVDPRYLCLCVEHTDFAPISLEAAKKRFEEQQ